jgi:uncharacterized protein DUF29
MAKAAHIGSSKSCYKRDYHTWTLEQARALRQGRLDDLDCANLAEEVEDLGRSEERSLEAQLSRLFLHLLKWRFQPEHRSNSWRASVFGARAAVRRALRKSPGLKTRLDEILSDAYEDAYYAAAVETGLRQTIFPKVCPWKFQQALDDAFWPD